MERVSITSLLAATDGRAVGFENGDVDFGGVGIDSRTVGVDEVFWAVQGARHDSHRFVADAVLGGAVAAVAESEKVSHVLGPMVLVNDTHRALGKFAAWYRQDRKVLVIGVTGSVGKTTTREMIHTTLSEHFPGMRSPANFNNHFGLPLSIFQIEAVHKFAVLELGASQVGEIRDLCEVASPEIGIVTAVSAAHLEEFGSVEAITHAKGELVESLPASGLAVLAGDDRLVRRMADLASCKVILVGEEDHNNLSARDVTVDRDVLGFSVDGHRYEVPVTGRHHLAAALSAIAVAREVGMSAESIADGLLRFQPVEGRCRVQTIGSLTVIDDTYNANPGSMQAACNVLGEFETDGCKLLVVGDMLELGESADACHYELGRQAAESGVKRILACGRYSAKVAGGAVAGGMRASRIGAFDELDDLLDLLDCWLNAGDVLLVKGSRATRMERVIDWLQTRESNKLEELASLDEMRISA